MKSLLPIALVLAASAAAAPQDEVPVATKNEVRRAEAMSTAAVAWLNALPSDLRGRAQLPFEDEARFDWHYVPRERVGVALGEMTPEQRLLLDDLLRTGLSADGYLKAHAVVALAEELGNDPGEYRAVIFGAPEGVEPWAWRVEGHHLSLNFTVQEDKLVAATPFFVGAQPARVPSGVHAGFEPFYAEEQALFGLVDGLVGPYAEAVRGEGFPDDVELGPDRRELFDEAAGASVSRMNIRGQNKAMAAIGRFTGLLHPDLGLPILNRYRADLRTIGFFWRGSFEPGEPCYVRFSSVEAGFGLEYLNRGNHVHFVLRDEEEDFGARKIDAWRAAEDG